MTSFLFRALIYYHVKKNNASQLKQFLQNLRQSCSGRAQQTQKTRKITAFQISQHSTTDWSGKTRCKGALANSSVQKRQTIRNLRAMGQKRLDIRPKLCYFANGAAEWRFRRAHNPKVGSTPNIAAPLFQIAPNNLQTPLNKTLIAFGGSIQKIFMRSPPRAEYAHRNSNVHGLKIL